MAQVSPSLFNFFNTWSFKSMLRVTKKNRKGNGLPPQTKASRNAHASKPTGLICISEKSTMEKSTMDHKILVWEPKLRNSLQAKFWTVCSRSTIIICFYMLWSRYCSVSRILKNSNIVKTKTVPHIFRRSSVILHYDVLIWKWYVGMNNTNDKCPFMWWKEDNNQ